MALRPRFPATSLPAMADPIRVQVRAAVLGFHPRDIAEVDPDDVHVAAAIAGGHLVVIDQDADADPEDDDGPEGPTPDEVRTALATVLGDEAIAAELVASIDADPAESVEALRRAGVTFTDDQRANVTELVAAGDLVTAQALILAEVATQVGLSPDDNPEA